MRDALLGLPTRDRDWVVVGASAEAMLAAGFQQVGRDFPVFLHPQTKEEYALARTERKSARGYTGFSVQADSSVTLEQDLARRDLTINAIAQTPDGELIDPYRGQQDLQAGILRHVSAAFVEDPVRVLRLARFAARFGHFRVAAETIALAREIAANGELEALVAERVWQELARGLAAPHPERMIEVLRECDALRFILPEVDRLFGVPQRADYHPEIDCGQHVLLVLQCAARRQAPLAVRWACLLHDVGKAETPADILPRHIGHEQRSAQLVAKINPRLRVPRECADLAKIFAREHGKLYAIDEMRPQTIVRFLQRVDAWRRPERFARLLLAGACDYCGRGGMAADAQWPFAAPWRAAFEAAQGIDAAAIARQCSDRAAVGASIERARVAAVAALCERTADQNPTAL